jgi:hypothetical protein
MLPAKVVKNLMTQVIKGAGEAKLLGVVAQPKVTEVRTTVFAPQPILP